MKYRELTKLVERNGWYHVNTVGSHRQYKHPTKPGRVTIAGKPNQDVYPKMLNSILRQAGLK
jgi:predicted RNA binding protein YcfA (HicA-like mRNA interferase family)